MCEEFDKLDKTIRIILFIPIWGYIVSGLYRIFKYVDNKSSTSLIIGIVCILFPILGFIFSIIDLISTINNDKVTFLVS